MKEYKCNICDKRFDNHRQLNGHKSTHREGGRYSVSRKKYADKECLNCGTTIEHSNKYCSIKCQHDYIWSTVTRPRVLSGNGSTSTMKKYLIEEYGENCVKCGQGSEWQGNPLTLQLDHIDGNSDNNNVNNIRLLCPNCHTQTDTYGSKGSGANYRRRKDTKRNNSLREWKGY